MGVSAILAAFDQDSSDTTSLPGLLNELLTDWGVSAPWVGQAVLLAGALLLAAVAHQVARRLILRQLHAFAGKTRTRWDDVLVENRFFERLTHLVPALVLYLAAPLALSEEELAATIQRVTLAYMVLAGVFALNTVLRSLNQIYESSYEGARERPIRSYVQVVSIFLWILAVIVVIATLMNRSPWGLLGGMGAMTAILMLVFKDSVLGLVASVQLTTNDMVRVGDWIEMPQFGADGDVVEILLTTVKVQNWDKTITTIPTYRLITDAFKNWRGMSESGVRRIKRSLLIDVNSVRFVDQEMLERFKKIQYIQGHLDRKIEELRRWNDDQAVDEASLINGRRLTNLGTFRAYLEAYLRHHPVVDPSNTLMVRQRPLTEKGLALQIYVFSKEQRWVEWEAIQADIFDHVLAAVSEFDLRVVQIPSGADVRALATSPRPSGAQHASLEQQSS